MAYCRVSWCHKPPCPGAGQAITKAPALRLFNTTAASRGNSEELIATFSTQALRVDAMAHHRMTHRFPSPHYPRYLHLPLGRILILVSLAHLLL